MSPFGTGSSPLGCSFCLGWPGLGRGRDSVCLDLMRVRGASGGPRSKTCLLRSGLLAACLPIQLLTLCVSGWWQRQEPHTASGQPDAEVRGAGFASPGPWI